LVTSLSFALGLPGKIGYLAGTLPADFAQILYHVIVLIQKLCYLHGWPDFFESDELDDETIRLISMFLGIMFGVSSAIKAVKTLSEKVALNVIKKLPRVALTKYSVYIVSKKMANMIGVKVTKLIFAKAIGNVIPIVGGFASASISFVFFKKCAKDFKGYVGGLRLAEGEVN
jgi:hypothetical protein